MLKKVVRNNVKIAEIMVAHLHSLKRNIERGSEKKDLGFLQDHAIILLAFGQIKVSDWVERNLF